MTVPMAGIEFDAGPTGTFKTLCKTYPDDTVYQGAHGFRALWGPIFYRGRANGTARILVIGQDPAQTEAVTRRILSGQAGRRVQGFVEKLGFNRRYLMVNAFLYGIYNQSMAMPHLHDPAIEAYRNKWLDAAFAPGRIEAVVTFGNAAYEAWQAYKATPNGQAVTAYHHRALHPTADEKSDTITRQDLLDNWNKALSNVHGHITDPDVTKPLVLYGSDFKPEELPEIPSRDLPMGLPAWMRSTDYWATLPATPGTQRANVAITVP